MLKVIKTQYEKKHSQSIKQDKTWSGFKGALNLKYFSGYKMMFILKKQQLKAWIIKNVLA